MIVVQTLYIVKEENKRGVCFYAGLNPFGAVVKHAEAAERDAEGSMQSMKRKHRSAQFKAQVALEALKGQSTLNELASK